MEKKRKTYNLAIGIIALVAIILVITLTGYFVSKPEPVIIQGEAEATEYRISGKVPGRIEEFYVKEGSRVEKGDTVVSIDSPEIRAKLKQASAAREAAMAQSKKAVNGARREQIAGAYELLQQAKVQEEILQKTLERTQQMYDKKCITPQKYDEIKARYDAAAAQRRAAQSQYNMAVNGAREEDKEAAAALVERAEGAIAEVESYLGELYLTAPAGGIISSIFPKAGELVGTGAPIMTVTDLNDIWFTFNIREDYLHGLRQGDRIRVSIPALDGVECTAVVNYISVRESYATWKATKETDMYDAKTFQIRAVPETAIEGIRPGMTVLVRETLK